MERSDKFRVLVEASRPLICEIELTTTLASRLLNSVGGSAAGFVVAKPCRAPHHGFDRALLTRSRKDETGRCHTERAQIHRQPATGLACEVEPSSN